MTNKTVVARIHASSKHKDSVEQSLKDLVREVLKNEPDVLGYSLHQDNEIPELFIMIESYKDDSAFEYHLNTGHLKVFQNEIEGKLEELSWRELTPV